MIPSYLKAVFKEYPGNGYRKGEFMELLKADHISKIYTQNKRSLQVLCDLSLTVQRGEFIAVLGRSGSGKSTLLNILAGLDRPTKGTVFIDGTDLFSLSENKRTLFRRMKTGFVFQSYELLPSLTVIGNIRLPQLQKDDAYVKELLDLLEIRSYENCYPDQLSGGEQQRAAIARALINHPSVLFADEPTGNLDSKTEQVVVCLLKELSLRYQMSILFVTHNEMLVGDADRVIRLDDGRIVDC